MGRAARYVEGHAILYADVAANPALDFDYARQWAARLRVEDLLAERSPRPSPEVAERHPSEPAKRSAVWGNRRFRGARGLLRRIWGNEANPGLFHGGRSEADGCARLRMAIGC